MATCHLAFFSPCGGTARVARALVSALDHPVEERDLTLPAQRHEPRAFAEDDFVIFCLPVYGGRMARHLKKILAPLKGQNTPCAIVAVYGNRAWEGALLDLHEAVLAAGFQPVAALAAVAEHSIAPEIATRRPDGEDVARLAAFGRQMFALAQAGARLEKAPGAFPQWERKPGMHLFPTVSEDGCVRCGLCVKVCPMQAISPETPQETEYELCIMCGACSKRCPTHARQPGTADTRAFFKPHLAQAAAARREPEFFPGTQTL